MDENEIAGRWREYIEELYKSEEENFKLENKQTVDIGPKLIFAESESSLKELKMDKACGNDNVQKEFIQVVDNDTKNIVYFLLKEIYETDKIQIDFQKNVINK